MGSARWDFERVLLARHGETEWNVIGRRQGQLDSPLTDAGRRQAEALAPIASAGAPDAIFSSPIGRAATTARLVAASLGLPVVMVDDRRELDHGAFAGMTNADIEAAHPGVLASRARDKYAWRFPGGESYEDAATRACSALDRMEEDGSVRPIVVTHEMVGRMLLLALLDLSPAEALARSIPRGCVLAITPARPPSRGVAEQWG